MYQKYSCIPGTDTSCFTKKICCSLFSPFSVKWFLILTKLPRCRRYLSLFRMVLISVHSVCWHTVQQTEGRKQGHGVCIICLLLDVSWRLLVLALIDDIWSTARDTVPGLYAQKWAVWTCKEHYYYYYYYYYQHHFVNIIGQCFRGINICFNILYYRTHEVIRVFLWLCRFVLHIKMYVDICFGDRYRFYSSV